MKAFRWIVRIYWFFWRVILKNVSIILNVNYIFRFFLVVFFDLGVIFITNGLDFFHIRLIKLQRFMFTENVLYKLIFSIIFCSTMISKSTNIRFILDVSSFVVISISYCSEHLCTEVAGVWLFTSMSSLMNLKVSSFIKNFVAKNLCFSTDVKSYRFMTNKFSLDFLKVSSIKNVRIFRIVLNNIIISISFIMLFIIENLSIRTIQFS